MRNEHIFQNKALNWEEVVDLIKLRIAFWVKSKWDSADFSINDMILWGFSIHFIELHHQKWFLASFKAQQSFFNVGVYKLQHLQKLLDHNLKVKFQTPLA
ncbi:hypothetical protein RHMOL_Rhmol02G0154600 [Rhododendron molle]|uniref:Uncharacterized protein n=1 Tax=Rhododendron molle TaxID=49168 RepID=A0ACC0PRT5_RHOML|nr:hypothetical protein RHMOL_Rhmol02G0154600 [Rhododendron molle]